MNELKKNYVSPYSQKIRSSYLNIIFHFCYVLCLLYYQIKCIIIIIFYKVQFLYMSIKELNQFNINFISFYLLISFLLLSLLTFITTQSYHNLNCIILGLSSLSLYKATTSLQFNFILFYLPLTHIFSSCSILFYSILFNPIPIRFHECCLC